MKCHGDKNCSFVVACSLESLSSGRQRSAQKHQIPVVSSQYVWSCLEKGRLLPAIEHVLQPQTSDSSPDLFPRPGQKVAEVQLDFPNKTEGTYLGKFRKVQMRLSSVCGPHVPV
ncbi:uncharacterized protein LOC143512014 [Brachyhypopomus gauderio]|uniref:uncharacterized protein LOC143512014 n=1 Tax=Brachyhypopomus gauderio TaxID=698409 RepID=UPI0040433E2F